MYKHLRAFVAIGAAFLFLIIVSSLAPSESGTPVTRFESQMASLTSIFSRESPTVYSDEDIAALAGPSVVRVIHQTKGEVRFPEIKWDKASDSFLPDPTKKDIVFKVDDKVMGTGFFIHPDGYLMTNAHVVSDEFIVDSIIARDVDGYAYRLSLYGASAEEIKKISGKLEEFDRQHVQTQLKTEIKVLNPVSRKSTMDDMLAESFSASIVAVHNDFSKDDKDIALLKIANVTDAPAIPLADNGTLLVGQKVYTVGFPGTADISIDSLNQSSFVQGSVNAVKDSRKKDFSLYQIDAKFSGGSSGSPVLDSSGKVVGISTLGTGLWNTGDPFVYAIPVQIARDFLAENNIHNSVGTYFEHLSSGFSFASAQRCSSANNEFALAEKSSKLFPVAKFIEPYRERCTTMIAKGQSVDTTWQEFQYLLGTSDLSTLVLFGGSIVLFLTLLILLARLTKRIANDEKQLKANQDQLNALARNGSTL